jgi:type IV pilus assembly protein PilC
MKTFQYLAKDSKGQVTQGTIDATSQEAAAEALETKSLTPISVKEDGGNTLWSKLNTIGTIPSSEKVMFSRQLSTLIGAGIPISQAMHILVAQTENKRLKKATQEVSSDIEGGLSLSAALEKAKVIYSPLYVSMVKAGEVGGTLDQTLERISDEIEKDHELIAKIRGAMAYPAVIMVVMVVAVIVVITLVIPQMAKVFAEMGGKLPPTTQFLIDLSNFVKSYGIFLAIGIAGFIFGYRYLLKNNAKFRYFIHFGLLKMPILGKKVINKLNVSRFSSTLSSLLSSGVTVLEALDVSSDALTNEVYRKNIKIAAEKVKNGSGLSDALKTSNIFPMIVIQMIAIGEETGTLDKILEKLSGFYQKEVSNTVANLASIMEPMIMVVVGLLVAFLVFAVMMPIYSMTDMFS